MSKITVSQRKYFVTRIEGSIDDKIALLKQSNASNVQAEVDSVQMSYSMGGASIIVAETDGDNLLYNSANDKGSTTVALTLAF